ncbi:hypothetical protein N7468_001916 [Penicillium chermesinum]|uniref:Fcf2 pre-rRNA processing C-terminal domain-containing protein n=1 Tax=Penicillium chermesinum TaxID=63820 RepID=A0A9W9PHJ7_9EURO|nr:uncharacterized protein N7468_001916 [Penicillium chermesinum]KAJ5246933.1 hypothetical protein N7468_001916 [Penicillium chermesinum]KAJ6145186.1 hypothetical protein N7470_009081 [Penicillium chermesinum]
MAKSGLVAVVDQHSSQDDLDLTENQIQQLLLEAEGRLRGSDVSISQGSEISSLRIPKLSSGSTFEPYVHQGDDIATVDSAQLVDSKHRELSNSLHLPQVEESNKGKAKATAGPEWFNLPRTEMTPEFKRDLQLLRMRSVLDPKRHYKKESAKAKAPEFSQVGTIIEGPTEFFRGRIAKKDRKKTFVAEAMALERENGRFRSKYDDIQQSKQSGKKAFYNNLRAKRNKKQK